MVESTTTDKQNAAQGTQQQESQTLESFMYSASYAFDCINGLKELERVGKRNVCFKVDEVNYTCFKRKTPAGNVILWIIADGHRAYEHNRAVFDAKTKELKASIFFTGTELFDMLCVLEDKHAALFD